MKKELVRSANVIEGFELAKEALERTFDDAELKLKDIF